MKFFDVFKMSAEGLASAVRAMICPEEPCAEQPPVEAVGYMEVEQPELEDATAVEVQPQPEDRSVEDAEEVHFERRIIGTVECHEFPDEVPAGSCKRTVRCVLQPRKKPRNEEAEDVEAERRIGGPLECHESSDDELRVENRKRAVRCVLQPKKKRRNEEQEDVQSEPEDLPGDDAEEVQFERRYVGTLECHEFSSDEEPPNVFEKPEQYFLKERSRFSLDPETGHYSGTSDPKFCFICPYPLLLDSQPLQYPTTGRFARFGLAQRAQSQYNGGSSVGRDALAQQAEPQHSSGPEVSNTEAQHALRVGEGHEEEPQPNLQVGEPLVPPQIPQLQPQASAHPLQYPPQAPAHTPQAWQYPPQFPQFQPQAPAHPPQLPPESSSSLPSEGPSFSMGARNDTSTRGRRARKARRRQ